MKIYISYFAQLRNFPKNLVGLSTAVWNPKWLQKNRDKNGAIWLDIPPLKPGHACDGLCAGKCIPKHPEDCLFLNTYYKQLQQIDFKSFYKHLISLAKKIQEGENLEEVNFALLVYEAEKNPCSERAMLKKWFNENGYVLEEWHK